MGLPHTRESTFSEYSPVTSPPRRPPERPPFEPPPKGLIRIDGQLAPRRLGFVIRRERLKCRHGHRIWENAYLREDVGMWCTHRDGAGRPECGAIVYLLLVPAAGGRRRLWAADVVVEELEHMEQQHMLADQVLEYFGADFPEPTERKAP